MWLVINQLSHVLRVQSLHLADGGTAIISNLRKEKRKVRLFQLSMQCIAMYKSGTVIISCGFQTNTKLSKRKDLSQDVTLSSNANVQVLC